MMLLSIKLNNPKISSLFVSLLIVLLVSLSCYPLMTYADESSFDDVVSVGNDGALRDVIVDFAPRSDIELDEFDISDNKSEMLMSNDQGGFSILAVASDISADESSFDDAVLVGNDGALRAVIGNATSDMTVNIALSCDIELDESLVIPADKHIVLMSYGLDKFFRLIGASGADTIIVDSGGVLELAGIIVTHPSATYGCGVTVFPGGVLTMYSGEIFGNKGNLDGGGVCNYGDFTMYGGVIYGNIARYGGGVLNVEGIFTLSGGTIFDNHASYSGGGLYSEAGDFTMTGGMILGNSAVGHGGGVFLFSSSSSLFDGGISGNTATSGDGGGVYNFQGTFTMFGGMVNGNTARYGGGVLNDRGIFTLSGGAISDNSVLYSGGGVFSDFGEFTMSGGMISRNTAGAGGGVFLSSDSSSLLGGVISDNTAVCGGGIAASMSVFGMFGGVISDNTALLGGGIYTRLGNFGMLGGVISNNAATEDGGGIYLESGFTDLLDGMVLENTATNNGGGVGLVHENLDKLWVYDGMVFSDNSASSAYDRAPEHDDIYHAQIGANVIWTAPFVQGYNNYDISYTYTPSILNYYVTVINSYAETSGAGYYFEDDFVIVDAGTRPGYNFIGWTVNEGDITLSNDSSAWFIMPASEVVITANWGLLPVYNIGYVLDGGSNPSNNPIVYTATDLPLSIADPFKANFTFLGWTVTSDSGISVMTDGSFTIPVGTTGNLVLTANWAELSATYNSGSGQIATAHWIVGAVTIDAFFAEQLTTNTGDTYSNGLYLKVVHSRGGSSENLVSLPDSAVSQNASCLYITTEMFFTYINGASNQSALHTVDLYWDLTPGVVSSRDGYRVSSDECVLVLGEFYTTVADLYLIDETTGHHTSASRQHYVSEWADVGKTGIETSGTIVALSGDTGIVVGSDATYTVSVCNVDKLATVTLWFEVDGTYFAGKSFKGLNGFDILGDIQWTQNGNTWIGRVTLVNLDSNGITSNTALDLFEMVFSSKSNQLGTATVKLVKADLSGYNDNVDKAVPIDSTITNNLIHTLINQYFSKYDINKDGKIDQLDLTTAQLFYMAEEGDANWNTAKAADLNGDGRVDIEDLIIISNNINWSSPLF